MRIESDPIQLLWVCPCFSHHSSLRELLQFLTRVDEAIFLLDPVVGFVAVCPDDRYEGRLILAV